MPLLACAVSLDSWQSSGSDNKTSWLQVLHPSRRGPGSQRNHDRFLIQKCEDAIRDGITLEKWCKSGGGTRREFPLTPGTFKLKNRAEGYFGNINLNGSVRTVMGCRQYIDFAPRCDHPKAAELLTEFVLGQFLSRAHSGIIPTIILAASASRTAFSKPPPGDYGQFPAARRGGSHGLWRELGDKYRWVMLTVLINDFSLKMGPIKQYLNEAACVVPLPEFMHVVENPSPEYILEVSIGYPFIDYAPIPNFFGYGPGKFGIAVKLFSFFLTPDKQIKVVMEFASAPRAEKVFDLNGIDPVYGTADLIQRYSLGLFDSRWLHDKMDTTMLNEHCSVHQLLMDGTATVWQNWLAEHKI